MLLCPIFKSEVEGGRSGGREEEKHANYPPLFFSQRLFCNLVRMIARVYDKNKPEEDTLSFMQCRDEGLTPALSPPGWSLEQEESRCSHDPWEWRMAGGRKAVVQLVVRSKLW